MKKAVLVCTFILAFAAVSSAQTPVGVGARIGANFANLHFHEADEADPSTRTGLVAGLFATVPVSGRFSFQPEVLFSQQGAKIQEGSDEGTIRVNYFNVPLLANIQLSGDADTSFAFLVGPQFGFRTSAEGEFGGETEDLKDDTHSTDVSIVGGLAVSIRNFIIDARYAHGLRNISHDEDGSDSSEVKNRVFSISVGIRFR